jgi:lysophospholipase L1-like esterase
LKPLLSIATLVVVVGLPELLLRAAGFQYESGVEFRIPEEDASFIAYQPDPYLLFKFDPAHPKVNSLGFPDAEVVLPKPPGVFRMLFLGDSCTQQGYPAQVAARLALDHGDEGPAFDAVTLAVAGYSSFQGRVIAERVAGGLEGDLALVYFGWNDHWLANGAPDSKRIAVQTKLGPLERLVRSAHERSRLMQLLVRLQVNLRRWGDPVSSQLRVPIAEYRANLAEIERRLRAFGMPVVFMTAPTSHYLFGAPATLVRDRFATDTDSVPRLHRAYNQVVREVAREAGAALLDLERDWFELSPRRLSRMFTDDGIHFSDEGLQALARRIAGFLREQGLAPSRPAA